MGAHPTLATEEARGMRLRIGVLRQRVKANLPMEFAPQRLTSCGGLELIRRYFRRLDLRRRADQVLATAGVRSDYGSGQRWLGSPIRGTGRTVENESKNVANAEALIWKILLI